ncbi:MAG: hydroxypyruvate isomerase family protein [Rhizobiales bacterium]|nr:hydroxypyruvate isomerase family protein [Hyphomicrobiales bacterium]NRB15640.1 hydroxypyruvate isomerase family protein [Hyphomicrobiales bacterium]
MPKFHANISMMFQEFTFLDRFEAAALAGFTAVEMLFPYAYEVDILKALLTKHKLKLELFNLYPGDDALGERGIAALPNRRAEFKRSALQAVNYAKALGCPRLHCMSGIVAADMDKLAYTNIYIENLKYLADLAQPFGINILIEALNPIDMPGYLVSSQQQALDIMQQVGKDNVKIQFDIYHCQMSQGNVAQTMTNLMPHIDHIQLADVPGRHEPGSGEINFDFLFKQLDEVGYTGSLGCEYRPRVGTLKGLGWLPKDGA